MVSRRGALSATYIEKLDAIRRSVVKFRTCLYATTLVCMSFVAAPRSGAQGAAQPKQQDQSGLAVSSGQPVEPLAAEPLLAEQSDSKTPQAQPSGDIRMQYVRMYFEQMSQDRRHRKDRVDIALRNGARLEGRIVSVGADRFTMRIASGNQETSVNFSDLSGWQLAPPHEHVALNVLALAGLELLRIATLPVTIVQLLSGSCGC